MMSGNIAVVYEKGVLRPLRPLDLPERTRLEIRIVEADENVTTEAAKVHQVLIQAGLIQPTPPTMTKPVTESERQQAADAYGQSGPLSDWIIAERSNR